MAGGTPPPPERREDLIGRERIDRIKQEVIDEQDERLHKVVNITAMLVGFLILVQFGLGLWSLSLQKKQSDTNKRLETQAAAIQKSRVDNVRDACNDQNQQHDEAISQLTKLLTLNLIDQAAHDPRATKDDIKKAGVLAERVKSLDTNKDQAKVLVAFDEAKNLAQPPIAQAISGQRTFTILLIDRLAPKQDCDERVRQVQTTK